MFQHLAAILLLVAGETLSIVAEVVAAKTQQQQAGSAMLPFWTATAVMCVAGALLIGGYMLGVRAFRDIWVVGVISLGSIVITEPFVNWVVFRELPGRGPLIGMVLAIGAIGSATLVK